jgi:PhoH-like ATPase
VELNHSDTSVLPAGYRLGGGEADTRILAVARNLQAEGYDVTVVSKDLPMRIKASSVGLLAEEYRAELAITSGWTGMSELHVGGDQVDALFGGGHDAAVEIDGVEDLPVHTGLVLTSERGRALGRVTQDGRVRLVRGDREAFGLRGRSAEQRVALDLLLDPEVGIVSMGGRAGTGKSALALCAGLEAVLERQQHRKVMVFRPLYAVGG